MAYSLGLPGICLLGAAPVLYIVLGVITGHVSVYISDSYQRCYSQSGFTYYIRPIVPCTRVKYNPTDIDIDDTHSVIGSKSPLNRARGMRQYAVHLWSIYSFWFRNGWLLFNCIITNIIFAYKIWHSNKQYQEKHCERVEPFDIDALECQDLSITANLCQVLFIFAALPLVISVYSTFNVGVSDCSNKMWCISTDIKYRAITLTKTVLFGAKIFLTVQSDQHTAEKYILTLLSSATLCFIAYITYASNYQTILSLPTNYPNVFVKTYLISYASSICIRTCILMIVFSLIASQTVQSINYFPVMQRYSLRMILPMVWLFWCKLYNNEISRFTSQWKRDLEYSKDCKTTPLDSYGNTC
eukprot:245546_1